VPVLVLVLELVLELVLVLVLEVVLVLGHHHRLISQQLELQQQLKQYYLRKEDFLYHHFLLSYQNHLHPLPLQHLFENPHLLHLMLQKKYSRQRTTVHMVVVLPLKLFLKNLACSVSK
jgi:hypothetical protein